MDIKKIKEIISKLLSKSKVRHVFVLAANATDGLTKAFYRTVSNEISYIKDTSNSTYFSAVTIDNTTKKIIGDGFIATPLDYLYQLNDVYINPDDGAPAYSAGSILKYNSIINRWVSDSAPVISLKNNFSDCQIVSEAAGQFLFYADSKWKNYTYNPTSISLQLDTNFSDVSVLNPQEGQILIAENISGQIKYTNKILSFDNTTVLNNLSIIYTPFSLITSLHTVPNILFPSASTWQTTGTTTINAYAFYFIAQSTGVVNRIKFIVGNGGSNGSSGSRYNIQLKITNTQPLTTSGMQTLALNPSGLVSPGGIIEAVLMTQFNTTKNQGFWVILKFNSLGSGSESNSGCLLGTRAVTDSVQPNFSPIYVNSGGGASLSTYPVNGSYIPYFELY